MGLGSRLNLPFGGSAVVFNYYCNFNEFIIVILFL